MGEKKKRGEKTDEYSGHYVIASSGPPERRPLERSCQNITFIVATSVDASRLPERRPTGTLTAHANCHTQQHQKHPNLVNPSKKF